ncbi:hypothetical protein F5X96DRAFT_664486, partial [Biscogniauxia mediterranea]
ILISLLLPLLLSLLSPLNKVFLLLPSNGVFLPLPSLLSLPSPSNKIFLPSPPILSLPSPPMLHRYINISAITSTTISAITF